MQIIDIYEEEDKIYIVYKENNIKETREVDYKHTFYVYKENMKSYEKIGLRTYNSKKFFDGYQKENSSFGVVQCKTSEKNKLIELHKNEKYKIFNSKLSLVDEYLINNYNEIIGSLNNQEYNFKSWNLYSIEVNIEDSGKYDKPISNWKYYVHHYPTLVYTDVKYAKTHRINSIKLTSFSNDIFNNEQQTIEFKNENEYEMIQDFINYFSSITIDCLICWKYELSLEYIKERYDYLGGNINEFKEKIYKTKYNHKISLSFKKSHVSFDSPVSYIYLSVFYLYYSSNIKGGFKEEMISNYFYGKIYIGNELYIKIFKDKQYLLYVLQSGELFRTTFRNFLTFISERIYIYFIFYLKNEYLIEDNRYINYDLNNKKHGGKTFNPSLEIHQNVFILDINSCYPNIIKNNNICFTTIVNSSTYEQNPELYLNNINKVQLLEKIEKRTRDDKIINENNIESYVYYIKPEIHTGYLPRIENEFISKINNIKLELKNLKSNDFKYILLDIRRILIKNFGNSIFGLTGAISCFYNYLIFESISNTGQKLLTSLSNMIISNNLSIIGGVTDGIMVKTNDIKTLEKICNDFYLENNITVKIEDKFDYFKFINKICYYGIRNNELISKGTKDIIKTTSLILKKIYKLIAISFLKSIPKDDVLLNINILLKTSKEDEYYNDNYRFNYFKLLKPLNEHFTKDKVIDNMLDFALTLNYKFEKKDFIDFLK